MEDVEPVSRGIFGLPNEVLLNIFNLFPTRCLVPLTPTCRHFHSLVLRLIHNRLQTAAGLDGHTLYLECHHPSAQLTASKMYCTYLGTDGLEELSTSINDDDSYIGQVKRIGALYSRFRPQHKEPDMKFFSPRRIPGDIPGSRTYAARSTISVPHDPEDVVSETITVDAHDLFSQLRTLVYLGKHEITRGLLFSIQEVSEGTIRVWRDWLSKQCERKSWTDGEPIVVHHETPSSPVGNSKGKARADSVTGYPDLSKDPSILWVNTRDDNVGVKFRVKERKWRRNAPVLFSSDIEVAVSYRIEFEEIVVRTTHLLHKLEEAETMVHNQTGKAIVFGSFRG